MKRAQLFVLLTLVVVTVAGCVGSLQINMDTNIHNSAGKGDLIVNFRGTDLVNKALKDGDFSEYISRAQGAGLSVRRYMAGESAVLELSGNFKTLEELNALQADILAPLKLAPVVERASQPGLFVTRNTYEVTFQPLVTDNTDSLEAFAGGAQPLGKQTPSDIMLTYRLTTPGTMLSSNALEVNKNSAAWTLSHGQMQSQISLGVLSHQLQYGRIAGATIIGTLLAVVAYRRLFP